MFKPEDILHRLETALPEMMTVPEPMPGDKWLVSSAMTKSIRRGETERALRAATPLYQHDRQNFWRRLHVAAMEDCSADIEMVVNVLTATASSAWRRRVGDLKAGLLLTRMLAESTKCRTADEIYMTLAMSSRYAELRQELAHASDRRLTDCATDTDFALPERCLALWLMASTKRYPADLMPQREGDLESAKEVLRSLDVPAPLTASCIAVMKRTEYPLCLFVPLLHQHIQEQGEKVRLAYAADNSCEEVGGLPLLACDTFNRIGKFCFRQLQQAVPKLSQFSVKQIGAIVFVLEGGVLDRFITSPSLQELRQAGEKAYAESTGLAPAGYTELRERLVENMDVLNDIRREKLHRYLQDATA